MEKILLYPIGSSDSCSFAASYLKQSGIPLTDHPSPEVTHLLLDTPSFDPAGNLRDGSRLQEFLRMLPNDITLIGGNLDQNDLADYQKLDLLKDPHYLAKNAAITAECALRVAGPYLKTTFCDTPSLILGWGRIGKCLAKGLASFGNSVTVAARKDHDRAMIEALGYQAVAFDQIKETLPQCKILFNTVPELALHSDLVDTWKNGIAIDLASYPGMPGKAVIAARGLPGKYAPESSGRLIAQTILRHFKEDRS